jgi:hypothetical protein
VRSDLTAVKFEVEKDEKTEMKDRKKGRNKVKCNEEIKKR